MNEKVTGLCKFIKDSRNLLAITGAGCSTESGIPDYRSPNGSYSKGHKPVTYPQFANVLKWRQRYWSRSFLGFPRMQNAQPNLAHLALSKMENEGHIHHIITQNVDGLHQRAGSQNIVELHGSIYSVVCLGCNDRTNRSDIQNRLIDLNPSWQKIQIDKEVNLRPDGDLELDLDTSSFVIPDCEKCGGILKPDVVMFGENVAKPVVNLCQFLVSKSDAVLIVGTSLQVMSIFRFVKQAHEMHIPIVIVSKGPTRADQFVPFKIEESCGETLSTVSKMI
eukprot:NODE_5588_length_994_cov_43.092997_g5012_i0.p1 GENE.NODE_5588_length_994_cov_43.092997_g5012_i0~~NODE_5588_length_994_cov_43.092997_g5012_i0.p1  ORF type:complete len:297 (-),score=45.65 NODE_5588_length_994_cov_43.092997_g5012_i0:103-936(-)